jgi:NTP pyrophosphatase (non-canonical NTP hydrolase)
MMHAALGICGEAGELADAIKKRYVYGKPLDVQNVIEELGDLRFYMEAVMNLLGIGDQEVLQANANKLAVRYKSLTYSDVAAVERADKVGE